MALGAKPIQKHRIQVYGMFGSFKVGPDTPENGSIRVNYFSTVASGAHSDAAGDSLGLLRELKPMRERVRVSDLRDLSSLLQRELDDRRVARDLVPYLRGEGSTVGFFPAILVALVPHGFLISDKAANYPQSGPVVDSDASDERVIAYGDFWSTHRFKLGTEFLSLGRLEIDPENTDIVVLDGQHRANAFRYATGTFDAAQAKNSIYHAFYDGVERPEHFNSELPVTIVWFESDQQIDPKLISRKLFVDVNTQAKEVSASRQVLLDDSSRSAILVGSLYRALASRAFDPDRLSLLHMGFDCENKDRHPLTLTVPEQVKYAMAYVGFSPDRFNTLDSSVVREFAYDNRNYARAALLAPGLDEGAFLRAEAGDREALAAVSKVLDDEFTPKLIEILESFPLTSKQVAASQALSTWAGTGTTSVVEAWDKVYRGGEGLYAAFKLASAEGAAAHYKAAIEEIDARFARLRAEQLPECESEIARRAFDTFGSTAGITGLWMAAHSFCRTHKKGWGGYSEFIERLQRIPADGWAKLLVDYKLGVVKELTPRLWPDIRSIILRAVQGKDPSLTFFDDQVMEQFNPDTRFLATQINRRVDAYLTSLPFSSAGNAPPGADQIEAWRSEAVLSLKRALALAELEPMHSEEVLNTYCHELIAGRLRVEDFAMAGEQPDEADEIEYQEPDG